MKFNAPKVITWWIALACAVVGVLALLAIIPVPILGVYAFWIVLAGLILLLLGCLLPGL